jgi:predicted nucleic acid-binding protein
LETDAKLFIQECIKKNDIELAWSFILDYENNDNPFPEIRTKISEWKNISCTDPSLTDKIEQKAIELMELGLRQKDAAHIACAIYANADYFITTDKKILNKAITEIRIVNPIDFVRKYTDGE